MARLPRLYAPRIPQLVQARFARPLAQPDEPVPGAMLDRISGWLAEEIERTSASPSASDASSVIAASPVTASSPAPRIALHAWAVLPEAVTLLATPATAEALALLMQALGRRLGSGLLRTRVYAGRYHNALLEPGRWVLPAMQWVETQAVTSGRASQATQWPWSSAAEHAGTDRPGYVAPSGGDTVAVVVSQPGRPALRDHPDYWQIDDTPFARQAAWRQRLAAGLSPPLGLQLESALRGQWALGEKIFLLHLGRLASRRVTPAPRGRPRKAPRTEGRR